MKSKYYTILVNGEPFNCYSRMSLKDVLVYLNFNLQDVIVEYNQRIVNYSVFDKVIVDNNDCVEVITIVGGG